jgi:hypothetical protein
MKNPSTPEELVSAIEALVASYMDEVRVAAQRAVERSLSRSRMAAGPSRPRSPRRAPSSSTAKRRTAAEIDEVCADLCRFVRARPGESMAALAEEMGVAASTLLRPMAQLRAAGQVRTVGERHLTRYFPAVVKGAAGKW